MSTSEKFLKAEAGKQTAFGTPKTPDFKLPFTGDYVDAQVEYSAEWDSGTWTRTEIVEQVQDHVTFTLGGPMFFELLPVFLSAGFGDIEPVGGGPLYAYDGVVSPTAVGAPSPYTFQFGGKENIGGTGPSIKIIDGYLQDMTLSWDTNSQQVTAASNWFGSQIDDNSGAGYAFQGAALPTTLGMMKGMLGALEIQDAATTGGDFLTMTGFDCSLIQWSLSITTGAAPKWAGDENRLTMCGVRFGPPEVQFSCTLRTNATNYAIVKTKADAFTFQELLLTLNGASSRQVKWKMTGRWLPNFVAHGRSNGEVVMAPTFRCATPHTQTTTPHYFGWELDTLWTHT